MSTSQRTFTSRDRKEEELKRRLAATLKDAENLMAQLRVANIATHVAVTHGSDTDHVIVLSHVKGFKLR